MAFFVRCISGNSLKGLVRGEGDDDDLGGSGGSTTPNDTAHGGSKFSSYSWKRLSAKSRSSLNSPKNHYTPPLSATSADGTGLPRAAMEPVMERTRSALTDLEAVKFLIEDWSHRQWRPATPQDQERFDRLEQSDIQPLVALGEGAYGSVNLCRIPAKLPGIVAASPSAVALTTGPVMTMDRGARTRSVNSGTIVSNLAETTGLAVASGRSASAAGSLSHNERPNRSATSGITSGCGEYVSSSDANESSLLRTPAAPADLDMDLDSAAMADAQQSPSPLPDSGEAAATGGIGLGKHSPSVNDPQLIVAVKRVPLGWNQERELMQLHRCQQCPFIVRLFGFVDDGTEHCNYVMEWAEGGDLGVMLASLKDRRGADKQRLLMSEASARYYMGCLLLALEFLHGHGLLHRDIKPSNLLLTSDGTAKLADLGFTVALDANGHTVGCCGTAGYIAPEVYAYGTSKSRMSYGVPADIWSAGATLYQTLTGHVVTDNPDELLKKGWRPPTHPRFTHQLQDLLNRMLSAKPTTRPQSATSVMRHPWFAGFDWAALREGRMKAPYVPADHRCRPHRGSAASGETVANVSPSAAAVTSPLPTPAAATAPSSVPQARGSHHPLGGGQRLATVIEGVSTQPNALAEGGKVMQRSALSGRGEGSIKRGREGLVRDGASFETALGTVTTAEVRAVAEGAAAAAAAAAAIAATSSVASDVARMSSGGGGLGDASGSGSGGLPLDPNNQTQGGQRHGAAQPHAHGHGLSVRFALGVAECA